MSTISAAFQEKAIPLLDPNPERLEGLGAWFAAEYQPLLRFAYFVSGDRETARDLVQECFVRVYRAGGRVEEDGFASYARRTIANLARSRFRRLGSERRAVVRIAAEPSVHATQPDIETHDEVWAAIRTLSPQQRAVVALRFYEHMPESAIASTLGVSAGTVKKQLSRALDKCRAQLEHIDRSSR